MKAPARIEIAVVLDGPGDEAERTTKIVFWSPEKLEAILSDEGTLGAAIREAVRRGQKSA